MPDIALAMSAACTSAYRRALVFKQQKDISRAGICKCVADWRDLTVLVCIVLVVLGAVSLSATAQTFSIVKGKVVEKGIGVLQFEGKPRLTNTISVLIENDDRVFDIRRGTIVKYPVTEQDIQAVEIGSEVELFVSAFKTTARVLGHPSPGTA